MRNVERARRIYGTRTEDLVYMYGKSIECYAELFFNNRCKDSSFANYIELLNVTILNNTGSYAPQKLIELEASEPKLQSVKKIFCSSCINKVLTSIKVDSTASKLKFSCVKWYILSTHLFSS